MIAAASGYAAQAITHATWRLNHCIPISVFDPAAAAGSVPTSAISIPPRNSMIATCAIIARHARIPNTIVPNATARVAANPAGGAPCNATPSTLPSLPANVSCPIAFEIIHVAI